MGVKNFIKFINHHCPTAVKYTSIIDYKNKILGIDANLMIYKNTLAIKNDILNNDIKINHIHSMINKLNAFKKYNIIPVFVFDGNYPSIKENTIKKRCKNGIDNLSKEIKECKQLIKLYGYTVIQANMEADTVLVNLLNNNIIDYIVSDDMDILIFGGKILLKNFSIDKNNKISEIHLNTIIETLNINKTQLIDIALILGCDYDLIEIKNIGPVKALQIVKQYSLIDYISNKDKDKSLISKYIKIHKYFNIDDNKYKTSKLLKYNKNNIIKYLLKFKYEIDYLQKKII